MRAGTVAIGHWQNTTHLNNFVEGEVEMFNGDGTSTVLTAPMTFWAPPGRKMGRVLKDVVWQNIYETPVTNVEELEATYITKSDTWVENAAHAFALESERQATARLDYSVLLSELGITEEDAQREVQASDYVAVQPLGTVLALSPIHGTGVFSTMPFTAGEAIGYARLQGYRTELGRYVNHSPEPNCEMRAHGDDVLLVPLRNIRGAVGGELGEELTVDYRGTLQLTGGAQ